MTTVSSGQQIRRVLVDDSDSRLEFNRGTSPTWFTATSGFTRDLTNGQPYLGSQHGLRTSGIVAFNFTGSQLWLIGTGLTYDRDGSATPPWSCYIDDVSSSFMPGFDVGNNRVLCDTGPLEDGNHQFYAQFLGGDGKSTFWVDQIQYTPSPQTTPTTKPTVIVSKTDPAIMYSSGSWQTINKTVTLTREAGATVNVQFNGTKVSWYGSILGGYPSVNSTASVTIDTNAPYNITIPSLAIDASPSHNQSIFETDTLPAGLHSMTVVYRGSDAPLTLDYLIIQESDILSPLPGAFKSPSPAPTPSADSRSLPSPSVNSTPAGVIVGSVLGGMAFIILLTLFILFILRRTRRRSTTRTMTKRSTDEESKSDMQLTPFSPNTEVLMESSTANLIVPSPTLPAPPSAPHPAAGHAKRDLARMQTEMEEVAVIGDVHTPVSGSHTKWPNRTGRVLGEDASTPPPPSSPAQPTAPVGKRAQERVQAVAASADPPISVSPASTWSAASSPAPRIPPGLGGDPDEDEGPGERIVVINRHEDTGLRIPEVEVVDLPPLYSER